METQLCTGIGLIVGFIGGLLTSLMLKKKSDIFSCLAEFVVYGKQSGRSDEEVHKGIEKVLSFMLKGYDDFKQNPEAAKQKLRDEENQTKEMKALIKACDKLIKKTNKIVNNLK